MAPGSSDRASGHPTAVYGDFFFFCVHHGNSPASHIMACGIYELGYQMERDLSRSWGETFTKLRTVFGMSIFEFSGDSRIPQDHSDMWDASGWTSFILQYV